MATSAATVVGNYLAAVKSNLVVGNQQGSGSSGKKIITSGEKNVVASKSRKVYLIKRFLHKYTIHSFILVYFYLGR